MEQEQEKYFRFYKWMGKRGMTAAQSLIFAKIHSLTYNSQAGEYVGNLSELAETAHCSVETVQNDMKKLKACGMVRWTQNGSRTLAHSLIPNEKEGG